jgi:hypothetical protein
VAGSRELNAIRRGCAVAVLAAVLGGCASVAVERAKDLSSAGIQYAQATAKVVDVASDAAVDADSDTQIVTKPRPPVSPEQQDQRAARLEELDAQLVQTISLYATLKRSVNAVEAYFRALEDLANGSQAGAIGQGVKSVAERVDSLSDALEKGAGKPLLTQAQVNAIGGLAKVVAAEVHGAKVARVLERDAPTIGRALALQERVLELAGDDIRNHLTKSNNQLYLGKVKAPYVKGDIDGTWASHRRTYLRVRALGQTEAALTSAQAAAKQMQNVWQRILSGEYSATELTAMLKDTEDLLEAVGALKDATKGK